MKWIAIISSVAASWIAPGVVQAQAKVLEPGHVVTGVLGPESGKLSDGSSVDCYFVQTQPGDRFKVVVASDVFYGRIALGRGTDCTSMTVDRKDDEGAFSWANITFSAGGGGYLLRVGSTSGVGAYRISLEKKDGLATSGLLPAGDSTPPAPWLIKPQLPDGTASTTPTGADSNLQPGQSLRDCPACPEMVVVPPGSFMMGSGADEPDRDIDEGPRHLVTIGHAFAVARYELSFDEWDACVADHGCSRKPVDEGWGRGNRPVIDVSWYDALEYVAWLSHATGQRYHLLSEAEWEYAARAGTTTPWNTGVAIITDDANFLDQWKMTVPVTAFPANAFGLYNMHGNVSEWVQDCYQKGYFGAPTDGSAFVSTSCGHRVVRGGNYFDKPREVRSAYRLRAPPKGVGKGAGIRIARSL